jgi:hypothetical protein
VNDRLTELGEASFISKRYNPFAVLFDPFSTFFLVDNVGIIAVMPLEGNDRVLHVHIAFWDKRLRGREELVRNVCQFVVAISQKILITAIPATNRVVLAFARRVGFEVSLEANDIVTLHFTNYSG